MVFAKGEDVSLEQLIYLRRKGLQVIISKDTASVYGPNECYELRAKEDGKHYEVVRVPGKSDKKLNEPEPLQMEESYPQREK